jgi:hypothetical protein
MTVGNAGAQPLTFGRAPFLARHVRRRPGFVDEDEAFGIKIQLVFEPCLALNRGGFSNHLSSDSSCLLAKEAGMHVEEDPFA